MIKTPYFAVLPSSASIPSSARSKAFLITDNWDDWFKFSTMYVLVVVDDSGQQQRIGEVKIGQFGMKAGQRRAEVPNVFDSLSEKFFSLGQDDSYYQSLQELGSELRDRILRSLRDIAADPELWERARLEEVTDVSLLRSVTAASVEGQFRRLARGGVRLTSFEFSYLAPRRVATAKPSFELAFHVKPESSPPSNIHVLIGRNGVGKTYLLNLMSRSLVEQDASAKQVGTFATSDTEGSGGIFANVVSVTFSAFDSFEPISDNQTRSTSIKYAYVGLKRSRTNPDGASTPRSPAMLGTEFVRSLRVSLQGAKKSRWRRAITSLETDPIFKEADVTSIADLVDKSELERTATSVFGRLSSGHKIVLLTITRLVETVEERTLVLLDEPEAHLHPPLLSAFVRALSDLLFDRNGVAIIATHSPVVLQEVPRNCVWKLRRTGYEVSAERPEIETFGENVGVLTREAFGLEVTQSGFHRLLSDAIAEVPEYDAVLARFGQELGAEARAIVRALEATLIDRLKR